MAKIQTFAEIIPPQGGRIHIVRVLVDPARDWQEAMKVIGVGSSKDQPGSTPQSREMYEAGRYYPPQLGLIKERDVILMTFGMSVCDPQPAIDWGKDQKLRSTNPREWLALVEHKPKLNYEIGMHFMSAISPEMCPFLENRHIWFRALYCDRTRDCGLRWHGGTRKDDFYWFTFVRES